MPRNKKLSKKLASIPKTNHSISLPPLISDIHSGSDDRPFVVLKFFQSKHECFSDWEKSQLKKLCKLFTTDFNAVTWTEILKNRKYCYRKLKNYSLNKIPRHVALKRELSDDLLTSLIEFGFKSGERIFGFRAGNAFFLLLLDKNHKIFKCTT